MDEPGSVPLILDVDTGVDDALALLYAAATPGVTLIGATAVMGNVTVDTAVTNTLAVLELLGLTGVEVARGASRPLIRDHEPFPVVHGELGLGDAVLPQAATAVSNRSAAALIVETARARPGEVVVVATGPLTNIALALAEEPGLARSVAGVRAHGGLVRSWRQRHPGRRGQHVGRPRCRPGRVPWLRGTTPRPSCLGASGWTSPNRSSSPAPIWKR